MNLDDEWVQENKLQRFFVAGGLDPWVFREPGWDSEKGLTTSCTCTLTYLVDNVVRYPDTHPPFFFPSQGCDFGI